MTVSAPRASVVISETRHRKQSPERLVFGYFETSEFIRIEERLSGYFLQQLFIRTPAKAPSQRRARLASA